MSEIDEIFSAKGAPNTFPPSSLTPQGSETKKKQKKDKKRRREPDKAESTEPISTCPLPETIHDPSLAAPSTKRPKVEKKNANLKTQVLQKSSQEDGETRFRDSRGTGPRKKTEEGWDIYKEDELGIRDEGGDTPLCPFDCDCCF